MKEKSPSYYVNWHTERLKSQHIVNNMIELYTDLVDYLNLCQILLTKQR